jgi:pimeloyl-ACP methyl ester carboxylesterase/L-rhamnose mutarotase
MAHAAAGVLEMSIWQQGRDIFLLMICTDYKAATAFLDTQPKSLEWEEWMAPMMETGEGDEYDPANAYPDGLPEVFRWEATPPPPAAFPGQRTSWNGFARYDFEVDGKSVTVVAPDRPAAGRPWAWHGEFFGHKPAPDIALLGKGFHVVYMAIPNLLGSPRAVQYWDSLYALLTGPSHGLATRPALVGLSRGGLYCYNWAARNPDKVACIYGDAPVCDLRSWPGGKGTGDGSDGDWALAHEVYGFADEAEAMAYPHNPVDSLGELAANGVPLLHVYGDADSTVPWEENTGVVAKKYGELGGSIALIAKPGVGHHPHGLDADASPIITFLWEHGAAAAAADARAARL